MSDLVTRLRALAALLKPDIKWVLTDLKQGFLAERIEKSEAALREAADALERANACWDQETRRADDLKAKLNGACLVGDDELAGDYVQVTRERDEALAKLAEAEKQKEVFLDNIQRQAYLTDEARAEAAALRSEMQHAVRYLKSIAPGMESHEPEVQMLAGFEAALSQPGPGAAYQERMRKLKAVVEAARNHKHPCQYLVDDAAECDLCQRLAALEKKP